MFASNRWRKIEDIEKNILPKNEDTYYVWEDVLWEL